MLMLCLFLFGIARELRNFCLTNKFHFRLESLRKAPLPAPGRQALESLARSSRVTFLTSLGKQLQQHEGGGVWEEQGRGLSRAGYAQVLRPESAVIDVKMSITRNVLKTLAAAAGEKADNAWERERGRRRCCGNRATGNP